MEQLKTNWENIGLSNDFLFGKIMRKPALCKRMLEIILGVKIDRLEYLESQKSIDEEWDARSIRLDIYNRMLFCMMCLGMLSVADSQHRSGKDMQMVMCSIINNRITK